MHYVATTAGTFKFCTVSDSWYMFCKPTHTKILSKYLNIILILINRAHVSSTLVCTITRGISVLFEVVCWAGFRRWGVQCRTYKLQCVVMCISWAEGRLYTSMMLPASWRPPLGVVGLRPALVICHSYQFLIFDKVGVCVDEVALKIKKEKKKKKKMIMVYSFFLFFFPPLFHSFFLFFFFFFYFITIFLLICWYISYDIIIKR